MDASFFSFRFSKQSRNSSSKPKGRNRSLLNETLESRQLLAADLWISEFMASNSETLATDDREYHDWVEIHNPSGEAVSLEGWYLTDDSNELDKWQFPAVELPANGFRVVHASNLDKFDVEEDEIHSLVFMIL